MYIYSDVWICMYIYIYIHMHVVYDTHTGIFSATHNDTHTCVFFFQLIMLPGNTLVHGMLSMPHSATRIWLVVQPPHKPVGLLIPQASNGCMITLW